jgi:hypothetical protein
MVATRPLAARSPSRHAGRAAADAASASSAANARRCTAVLTGGGAGVKERLRRKGPGCCCGGGARVRVRSRPAANARAAASSARAHRASRADRSASRLARRVRRVWRVACRWRAASSGGGGAIPYGVGGKKGGRWVLTREESVRAAPPAASTAPAYFFRAPLPLSNISTHHSERGLRPLHTRSLLVRTPWRRPLVDRVTRFASRYPRGGTHFSLPPARRSARSRTRRRFVGLHTRPSLPYPSRHTRRAVALGPQTCYRVSIRG